MITKEICELINKQINAELWSAFYYLSMSLDARHKGNCGVANWFYVQAREELDHSRILQNYLISRGERIKLDAMQSVCHNWESSISLFEDALKHEQKVTEMIHAIAHEAYRQNDYATINIITWFVNEQVEEEQDCKEMLQQFLLTRDNPCLAFQLDNKLSMRKYERPKIHNAEIWIA
ncbi:MAG: ferritin [Bacteroidaceae bacterium]|nr:ferritin [Bacteroidaceae bacterium]